jgi:hypothetical protein
LQQYRPNSIAIAILFTRNQSDRCDVFRESIKPMTGVLVMLFAMGWAGSAFADTNTEASAERIARLEAIVLSLEKRIAALEGAAAQQQPSTIQVSPAWQDKSNWRSLKKGMTREKVRSILGEPADVRASGPFEYWRWGASSVTFHDERVYGWNEP